MKHKKLIYIFLFLISLIGIAVWARYEACMSKKASSNKLSILLNPDRKKNQFLEHDAIVVSEQRLADKFREKGVSTPVFLLPKKIELTEFLKHPLKEKRNTIFTFGVVASSGTIYKYEKLFTAFTQAFEGRDDVILKVYLPSSKKLVFQNKLIKKIEKLDGKNIFLMNEKNTSEVEFYKSLDCYLNAPFHLKSIELPCKALSLGIPLITDQINPIFTNCDQVLAIDLNSSENSLAKIMIKMYSHYDLFLAKGPESRNWSIAFEKSQKQSFETMKRNLTSPSKLIFGKQNLIHEKFLQTNSPSLYQKYLDKTSPSFESELNKVIEYLRPLSPPKVPSGIEGIDCVYVINLDERSERWETVKKEFVKQSITPYRVSAINGWKIPKKEATELFDENSPFLNEAFGGALGCLLSHVSVYKNALEEDFETIWICEDDITFKQDARKVSSLLKNLSEIDPEWDVLYTDSCLRSKDLQQPRPNQSFYTQVYSPINNDLVKIHGRFNTHSMIFSKRGLKKVFQYFTQGHLWAPIDIDIHYTPGLREYCTRQDLVTSIYDSFLTAFDGSSDTQFLSPLNQDP